MEKYVMAVLTVIVCAGFAIVAARAWGSRMKRQADTFPSPDELLVTSATPISTANAFYVATTFTDNSLERIAAHGLGARGFAEILVFNEGIQVNRTGERSLSVPRAKLLSVSFQQVAIDKAVENGGLLVVDWQEGPASLALHLRIKDTAARDAIFESISTLVPKKVNN